MWGPRGITCLVWLICLAILALTPLPGLAEPNWRLPLKWVEAQTPLEAQMLGEKPFQADPSQLQPGASFLLGASPLVLDRDGGATIRLPRNLELRISFLYDAEQTPLQAQRPIHSHLLFKYAMDYRLLPNLQVGLSGFLYHPQADTLALQRRFGGMVMGWGPGIKYDLGRWSFAFKSQLSTGSQERSEGLENWFRVWYAF
jgi:hypothetical protein